MDLRVVWLLVLAVTAAVVAKISILLCRECLDHVESVT